VTAVPEPGPEGSTGVDVDCQLTGGKGACSAVAVVAPVGAVSMAKDHVSRRGDLSRYVGRRVTNVVWRRLTPHNGNRVTIRLRLSPFGRRLLAEVPDGELPVLTRVTVTGGKKMDINVRRLLTLQRSAR
jgi:hypothetical protein